MVAAYEMVYPQPHGGRGSVLCAERSGSDGGAIPRCIDEHAPEHEPEGSDGWEGVRHRRVRRVDRDRVGVMVEGRTSGDGVESIIDSSSRPKGGAPPPYFGTVNPGLGPDPRGDQPDQNRFAQLEIETVEIEGEARPDVVSSFQGHNVAGAVH